MKLFLTQGAVSPMLFLDDKYLIQVKEAYPKQVAQRVAEAIGLNSFEFVVIPTTIVDDALVYGKGHNRIMEAVGKFIGESYL